MILKGYRTKIFRPECNPDFQSLHCIAYLDEDVSEVLPYLNAALGGENYTRNPPSVTFKVHGRLITVHSRKIAVNALRDEKEAHNMMEWLKNQINETWNEREKINPKFEGVSRPRILEVLRFLPRTSCRECGFPTCTAFAVHVAEGAKGHEDCPRLSPQERNRLLHYLGRFLLEDI